MASLSTNPRTGQPCYLLTYVLLADLTPPELTYDVVTSSIIEGFTAPCPDQPGAAPGAAPPPPTPAQLAEAFWYAIPLPVPHPASAPDYATTGKPAYLTTGDTVTPRPWTHQTPFGLLTITARATTTVDWGDAVTTGPYTTAGAPYPSGTIVHTYTRSATVTITATQTWTATWTIGARHGVLVALHTTGRLPDFPVHQLQAVVTG